MTIDEMIDLLDVLAKREYVSYGEGYTERAMYVGFIAQKLRSMEAKLQAADSDWAKCDKERCDLIDKVEKLESAIDSQKGAYEAIFRIFTKRLAAADNLVRHIDENYHVDELSPKTWDLIKQFYNAGKGE